MNRLDTEVLSAVTTDNRSARIENRMTATVTMLNVDQLEPTIIETGDSDMLQVLSLLRSRL
jgi:hypothetical protein